MLRGFTHLPPTRIFNSFGYGHFINYFDNLLPELSEIRDRIVARHQARSRQPIVLLKQIGKDKVGAIALYEPNDELTLIQLDDEVLSQNKLEKVLCAYKTKIPLGMLSEEDYFCCGRAGKNGLILSEMTAVSRKNHPNNAHHQTADA